MRRGLTYFSKPVLLMVGAPGTGKSTIGQKLSEDLKLPLFSSGLYLRSLIRSPKDTPLVRSLRESMKRGSLVNSEVVIKAMECQLMEEESTSSKAILFDGCPRARIEVEALMKMAKIKAAIYMYIRDDVLLEKLAGRRECERCHKNFNFSRICRDGYDLEPLLPENSKGVCDKCGGKLIKRDDDLETTIAQRMKEYYAKTYPLINEFYEKNGILKKVVMYRGINEYDNIKSFVLDSLQSK